MEGPTEIETVRTILGLARGHINHQEPDTAIRSLKEIKDRVDAYPYTPMWAEYPLLVAEALTAKHSEAAGGFLREAETKIGQLHEPSPELEFRVHDHFGYFYDKVHRSRTLARKHYELAKTAALRLGVAELVARTQLKMVRLDLEIDRNPELENFKTLRRVGHDHGFTCQELLTAWLFHCGETDRDRLSAVYARGMQKRSEEYFLDLLRSVHHNR